MNVEDRLALFDLISRYSYTYDENLMDEFIALFTDDAEVDLGRHSKGAEEIRKQVEELRQRLSDNSIQPGHYQAITVLTGLSECFVVHQSF